MSGNDLLDRENDTDKGFSDVIDNNWSRQEQNELKDLADKNKPASDAQSGEGSESANTEGPADNPFNFHSETGGSGLLGNAKQKVQNKLFGSTKNKVVAAGAGAGGGGALLIMVVMLLIFLGSFKIINFGEVMATAGMARFNGIMQERTTQDIFDAGTVNGDGSVEAGGRSIWDKITFRNLDLQLADLGNQGKIKFNVDRNNNLTSMDINGQRVAGLDELSQKYGGDFDQLKIRDRMRVRYEFTKATQTAVGEGLQTESRAVRGQLFDVISNKVDFGFERWRQAGRDFFGTSPVQADTLNTKESFKQITDGTNIGEPSIEEIAKVTKALKDPQLLDKFLKTTDGQYSPSGFAEWLKNNPTESGVNFGAATAAQEVASKVSVAAMVMALSCMANETFSKAGDINQQNETAAIRIALQLVSARDQAKFGAVSMEALGAMSRQLDGGDQSPGYQNNTNRPVDPTGVDNPKARVDTSKADLIALLTSPTRLGGIGLIASQIPGATDKLKELDSNICGRLLSPAGMVGVAGFDIVAQVIVDIFTGGLETVGEEAAGQATMIAFLNILKDATFNTVSEAFSVKAIPALLATGVYGVGLKLAATALAGTEYSGADRGGSYVEESATGFNLLNIRQTRSMDYGAPIPPADASESDAVYTGMIQKNWESKGTFARYFSPYNPYSLTGAVAAATPGSFASGISSLRAVFTQFGKILQPLAMFRVFGNMFAGGHAKALSKASYDPYNGLPQWGYTKDELNKMRTDPSYSITQNLKHLSDTQIAEMDTNLGPCFDGARSQVTVDADPACSAAVLTTDAAFRYRLYKLDSNIAKSAQENISKVYPKNDADVSGSDAGGSVTGNTNANGFAWPMTEKSTMSQCFTWDGTYGHPGLDIFAAQGTPIFAMADGVVTDAGNVTGYGPNFVAIKHNNGFGSSYGHMDSKLVKVGDVVKQGQQIGTQGNLGDSRGSHLHLNVFPDHYSGWDTPNVDPLTNGLTMPASVNNQKGCK